MKSLNLAFYQNETLLLKTRFLLIFLFSGISHLILAQCPAGNITLTTQAQVDNFTVTYPGCTHILGSLIIGPSADIVDLNGLSGLTQIDGGLLLLSNTVLTDVSGLNGLTSIGTEVNIQSNPVLGAIDLSGVSAVNVARIIVSNNAMLTSALMPTDVVAISDRLSYYNNPLLASISEMNDLTSIGDVLEISYVLANPLPAFTSLTAIGTNVPSATSGLYLYENPNIAAIPAFPVLNSIGGTISVQSNPKLAGFDLSAVSTHDVRSMVVSNNPVLTSALLPTDVTAVSDRLQYFNNPLLATISEMNSLTSVGDVLSISHVLANPLPAFNSLTAIGTNVPSVTSGLYLDNNPNITAIPAFPVLNSIGGTISVQLNQKLAGFDLSAVSTHNIRIMVVSNNPVLTSALLPTDVTAVSDRLQYFNNPLLATISEMNNLTSVGDILSLSHVLANPLPAFNSLTTIGTNVPSATSGLYVYSNPNCTTIPAFPVLNSIGGTISIQLNQNLTGFDLSAVSTHDMRAMIVNDNPALSSALLPADVTAISERLQYYNNPMLEEISAMNDLQTIGQYLSISNTVACRLPNFPSLSYIGIFMNYSDNPKLAALPKLANGAVIAQTLIIVNNPSLSYCAIQAVCDFLQGPNIRNISGNAGACLDEAAVTASCLANDPYPEPAELFITGPDYCAGAAGPLVGLSGSLPGVSYQLQTENGDNLGAPVAGTGLPIGFGIYPNETYQVVADDGCTKPITGTVNAQPGHCAIAVPNFCTCNAPDGRAAVTVKISAPSGQNWTVKAVTGLYAATSPPAPAAPVPMPVGTPLTDIGGNMYTLDGIRKTDKGYWVQVTNGSTDFDVMVGNAAW